jgi:hypothetical protein
MPKSNKHVPDRSRKKAEEAKDDSGLGTLIACSLMTCL